MFNEKFDVHNGLQSPLHGNGGEAEFPFAGTQVITTLQKPVHLQALREALEG